MCGLPFFLNSGGRDEAGLDIRLIGKGKKYMVETGKERGEVKERKEERKQVCESRCLFPMLLSGALSSSSIWFSCLVGYLGVVVLFYIHTLKT